MKRTTLAAFLALSSSAAVFCATPTTAGTEITLYSPTKSALGCLWGTLHSKSGALFGTAGGCKNGKGGQVFKLTYSGGTWSEKSILKFDVTDGATPEGALVQDSSGNLYGLAKWGGKYGYGVAFQLSLSGGKWKEKVLYDFGAVSSDPAYPNREFTIDSGGNLYGTTEEGGSGGLGTVFELYQSGGVWTETTLYSFIYATGTPPEASLHRDSVGNLFGTTRGGGAGNCGVVYVVSPVGITWTFQTLYTFTCGSDGTEPSADALIEDSSGVLYGTTALGGTNNVGVAYTLAQSGSSWTETVIHNFNGDNGSYPNGLHWGGKKLYGTTYGGGQKCGCGVVFQLSKSHGTWKATTLYEFTGGTDGDGPSAQVILDDSGNVYGTALGGGGSGHYGTVWEVIP